MRSMRAIGRKISNMARVLRHGVSLEVLMRLILEIFIRERKTEKGVLIGKMDLTMRETSWMGISKVLDAITLQT